MILHIRICTDLFRAVAFERSDNSATMVEVLSAFLEKLRNTCPVLWCDVGPPCGTGGGGQWGRGWDPERWNAHTAVAPRALPTAARARPGMDQLRVRTDYNRRDQKIH